MTLSYFILRLTSGQLFLVISNQQFVHRFPLFGYGTDGAENADPLDMETGIKVVEEGIRRILLPGIGVGKHSFATRFAYFLTKICQGDLFFIPKILRHIGGAGIAFIDRFIRRIKIKEGFGPDVLSDLPVVAVQDNDVLQQLVVKADQFLFQQFHPAAETERNGQLSITVHGINAVIASAHEEDKKGGTGDVIRIPFIVIGAFLHEVGFSLGMLAKGHIFVLYPGKHCDQLFRGLLDHTVDIDQALVGVVDDTADFRIGLSYSEEQGTAPDKRFDIRVHLSEVFRK